MWACNLHESYADFKSRVQNFFRKYEEGAKRHSQPNNKMVRQSSQIYAVLWL